MKAAGTSVSSCLATAVFCLILSRPILTFCPAALVPLLLSCRLLSVPFRLVPKQIAPAIVVLAWMYRFGLSIPARGTISRYAPAGTGLPHDNGHERRYTGHQASAFISRSP